MAIIQFSKITEPQIKYIEQLAIDLGFDRHTRNAHIADIIRRPIHYLDELTKEDAHKVIDTLKAWKEG